MARLLDLVSLLGRNLLMTIRDPPRAVGSDVKRYRERNSYRYISSVDFSLLGSTFYI